MATEIERKYLLRNAAWQDEVFDSRSLRQFYLSRPNHVSIRIRITDDVSAKLTIKSGQRGLTRDEFEYEIPVSDAVEMIALRKGDVVEKTRYRVRRGDAIWEIDAFAGENEGLVVAEIELDHEKQSFDLPDWLGAEVTGEPRYYNASLSEHPFKHWSSETKLADG